MASNFARNSRKIHEMRSRPAVEKTLRVAFAEVGLNIARISWTDPEQGNGMFLEKNGVDGDLYFGDGSRLTFQAKALEPRYATFGTITIEYYNDPATGLIGDWFTCMAQIYVCGYTLEDYSGMRPWAVVDYPALKIASQQGRIPWLVRQNSKTSAMANFKYVTIDHLPKSVLIARLNP